MNMACNIDARGQKVRRVWGIINLLAAVALAAAALFWGPWWLWIIAAVCLAGGLFALYEARKKWCVVRAMGIKTPM